MAIFRAKNTLLRERDPAFGQMGVRLGMQFSDQEMGTTQSPAKLELNKISIGKRSIIY
jgi:hypothetical protein